MRGRKKLFILAALLSALLIISVVFSSGVVDVLTLSLGGSPAPLSSSSSTPEVSLDPNTTIKDYEYYPDYQIDETFNVSVNVTLVTDLLAWQVNVSWGDASMLNVSNIFAGEFLNVGAAPNYTTSSSAPNGLGFVINKTDNATGYTAMGESILGSDTGVSGNGTLVTIEFQVRGYGYTNFTISVGGILPTTLLNSTLSSIAFDIYTYQKAFINMEGWFDNRITGDSDSNGVVTISDMGEVSDRWSSPAGVKPYARFVDWDDNGVITISDMGIVSDNWNRVAA